MHYNRVVKKILYICAVMILILFTFLFVSNTKAATAGDISGYAWSSNIGWISFRGATYGVNINQSTGLLSGYAWSSNIGWISFNNTQLTGCPTGLCQAKLTGNNFSGWARVLSANGNGWDGWISLSGSTYGLTLSGTTISGYAWGGEVVGWIKAKTLTITPLVSTCADGIDNDGDGRVDNYDVDCGLITPPPGFTPSMQEIINNPQCNNGYDDDGDGLKDYPADPDCINTSDNLEQGPVPPDIILTVGITTGSASFESLNVDNNGATIKLGISITNATTTTTCTRSIISGGSTSTTSIPTGGVSTYTTEQTLPPITARTKVILSCTTGNKTGSDSVEILIKKENEF
jgi:hypothetical protein